MTQRFGLVLTLCGGLLFASALRAQEPAPPAAELPAVAPADQEAAAAPAAKHAVTKGPLRIETTIAGVFESAEMAEVAIRPEEWTAFEVVEVVEPGTMVAAGDTLVRFDTEDFDEALAEMERAREASYISLRADEEELRILEQTTPLDLAAAERAKLVADDELKHFIDVAMSLSVRGAEYSLKSSQFNVEYSEEELKQLEQMYAADDLTEESEEIILLRSRRDVETSRFYLENAQINYQRTVDVTIPRQLVDLTEGATRTSIALDRALATLPMALSLKQLEVAAALRARTKSDEQFAKLQQDRAWLTVTAPTDGIVYYGQCVRGQWSSAAVAAALRPEGTVAPKQVIMTIVKPRPMFVRASLPEASLHLVAAGIAGRATPTAWPNLRVPVAVEQVSVLPAADGTYDVRLSAEAGDDVAAVLPGMTASIKLTSYRNAEALTVPEAAVFAEEEDDSMRYVYLVTGEGQSEKREVTVGRSSEGRIEIVAGLEEGQEILAAKP